MHKIESGKEKEGTNGRSTPKKPAPAPQPPAASLQQVLGNRAVAQLGVQRKMTLNAVGDKYEQEADAVASQVVRQLNAPQPTQRQATEEEEPVAAQRQISVMRQEAAPEEEEALPTAAMAQRQEAEEEEAMAQRQEAAPEEEEVMAQRQEADEEEVMAQRQEADEEEVPLAAAMAKTADLRAGGPVDDQVASRISQAQGGGATMSNEVRQPMEQAFGRDFSGVRIHTDGEANQLNQALQARAFTTGQDIFFRQGEYNPIHTAGQELLAHELTHVVQQNTDTNSDISRKNTDNVETMPLGGGIYTVVRGDSLNKISVKNFGEPKYWKNIYEENQDQISNSDLIYPGMQLKIPEIQVPVASIEQQKIPISEPRIWQETSKEESEIQDESVLNKDNSCFVSEFPSIKHQFSVESTEFFLPGPNGVIIGKFELFGSLIFKKNGKAPLGWGFSVQDESYHAEAKHTFNGFTQTFSVISGNGDKLTIGNGMSNELVAQRANVFIDPPFVGVSYSCSPQPVSVDLGVWSLSGTIGFKAETKWTSTKVKDVIEKRPDTDPYEVLSKYENPYYVNDLKMVIGLAALTFAISSLPLILTPAGWMGLTAAMALVAASDSSNSSFSENDSI